MTKILLIGSSGYIGSQLTLELVKRNFDVRGIDINRSITTKLLTYFEQKDLGTNWTSKIVLAINRLEPDFIIHMAGLVGYPACDENPELADILNHKLLAYTAEINIPVLMLSAGDSIFGKQETNKVNEYTWPDPTSIYGQTKLAGEKLAIANDTAVFRLASVYGLSPQMRWDNLIHNWYLTAIKENALEIYQPDTIRNFVSITTVTNRIIQWIRQDAEEKQRLAGIHAESLAFIQHLVDLTITKADIADNIKKSLHLRNQQEINIYSKDDNDPENRNYSLESIYGRDRLDWISTQDEIDLIYQAGIEVHK